jgi:hypothetical protein
VLRAAEMGSRICESVMDDGMSETSVSESRERSDGDRGDLDMSEFYVRIRLVVVVVVVDARFAVPVQVDLDDGACSTHIRDACDSPRGSCVCTPAFAHRLARLPRLRRPAPLPFSPRPSAGR